MGTRFLIGVRTADKVRFIYGQFDGYVKGGAGELLLRNYNTRDKALALLELGDISSLKSDYFNIITRAKEWERGELKGYNSPNDFIASYVSIEAYKAGIKGSDYAYLWDNGRWLVAHYARAKDFDLLENVLFFENLQGKGA